MCSEVANLSNCINVLAKFCWKTINDLTDLIGEVSGFCAAFFAKDELEASPGKSG